VIPFLDPSRYLAWWLAMLHGVPMLGQALAAEVWGDGVDRGPDAR